MSGYQHYLKKKSWLLYLVQGLAHQTIFVYHMQHRRIYLKKPQNESEDLSRIIHHKLMFCSCSLSKIKIIITMLIGVLCKFAEDPVFSWYTMDEVLNE